MEKIYRKIVLEDSTDRNYNSPTWDVMTASTFYIKILLTQSIDDMGIFADVDYLPKTKTSSPPNYSVLTEKLKNLGYEFPFMTGATPSMITGVTGTTKAVLRLTGKSESDYYNYLDLPITGYTDSKLEDLRSYSLINPFRVDFDIEKEQYDNYKGESVSGVSRIKIMDEPRNYVFDTEANYLLGTDEQKYGLRYLDYTGKTRTVINNNTLTTIPLTEVRYIGEGWNKTNISLSASTKEEFLFGIISLPVIKSDIFIDRGITSVLDKHLRLSEINDLGHLSRYGNGFYSLNKQ